MRTQPIFTIGHSTHPIEEFIRMLRANGVDRVVDVRTVPGSRHNPQFGEQALSLSLIEASIRCERIAALGGLRHTLAVQESINGAWRNRSFRSYADYTQTKEFVDGLGQLLAVAEEGPVAIMCAEAVPWRCHRSLIGDALLVRDINETPHPHTVRKSRRRAGVVSARS
ncbi:uncharacterized protein DUF488 [Rhodoglobus vestalii]|uniref:Uncharacterized protein DUF488 n=1 Tax=Rhodoglobus vestalii TaxID=193384 RepID=A0A8H2K7J0_9MICO|nr:DUF488 domain-containing protein [Rhodoglobus vestalii]TQO19457.1 uncharacterized protein DUF488 [Rhodoglobus vestalii]